MNAKDEVVEWLRDAYAMERSLEITLKKQSDSNKQSPGVRGAATRHLEETRQHARTVELLLTSLGADTSTVKTGVGMTTELLKGLSTKMSRDEVIKDLLASYAMEHFEIACYEALVTAAEAAGLAEVADACEQIILDEQQMAERLLDALPLAVEQYVAPPMRAKAA